MTKVLNPKWVLLDRDVPVISFTSDQYLAWITREAVIIYDLTAKLGYAAVYHENSRLFEGELRQLWVSDTVYAPDHTEWLWMTEDDKKKMIDIMRKLISFRSGRFPGIYADIWKSGVFQVKTLVIQKPGEKKYYGKWLPGIG